MSESGLRYIKNNSELNVDLPKIFCCCHPADSQHLKQICDDLLAAADCIVFYYPEGAEPDPGEAEAELQHMNLFIPVISANSIFKESFVSSHAFKIAEKHGIPILPIMLESGLEEAFNERFGNIQCLLRNGDIVDATSVPYTEKLKNALENILNLDADRRTLKNAFDASIFLSYRKKDRASAQELIRLIHEDERCRNIAIWYDEFLLPGEDFNTGIRTELEQSTAFVMAVTPHIAEENNYIQIVEYPMAVSLNKPVIPCEVEETQKSLVSKYFPGIGPVISTLEADDVRKAILDAIEKSGSKPVESSSGRDLLMGIAYLNGICTEKNTDIAFKLIYKAAEAGEPGAMRQLAVMYQYGSGTERNLDRAIAWQTKLIEYFKHEGKADPKEEYNKDLVPELFKLAELQGQRLQTVDHDDLSAHDTYNLLAMIAHPCSENFNKQSIDALRIAADANELRAKLYMSQGWFSQARAFALQFAIQCRERIYEQEQTKTAALELSETLLMDGTCCEELKYSPGIEVAIKKAQRIIPDTDIERDGHYAHILLDLDKAPSSEEYGYFIRVLKCCNSLCSLFNVAQWWFSAEEMLNATVGAGEKLAELVPTTETKRLLGQIYFSEAKELAKFSHKYKAAPEYYNKARAIAEELYEATGLTEYRVEMAEADMCLAKICMVDKDNKQALELFTRANAALKEISEEMPFFRVKDLYRQVSGQLSDLHYALGDKEKAYQEIERTEKLAEDVKELSYNYTKMIEQANVLLAHAEMLRKDWEMDEALEYMEKGCDMLRGVLKATNRVREMKLYVSKLPDLISLYRMCGEFDKANEKEAEMNRWMEDYSEFFK